MKTALIGHTGFVGTTLLRQRSFDSLYRSTNIEAIAGQRFDLVVCAGAPAQKWLANREPEADRASIQRLMDSLANVEARRFVLVSTVDVFADPQAVDEDSLVPEEGLHAYGRHRRMLESFVQERFADHCVLRLPGLVGPGLRKNVIYDLLNDNNLNAIDCRGLFQFYPMVNLWSDIRLALDEGIDVLHLAAEPISVADVAGLGFGKRFDHTLPGAPARYDMRSRHASLFSGSGAYQYSRKEVLLAIRAYAQSEPAASGAARPV